MVADTVVTETGPKTQHINAYFNVKAAKKLQFCELKCHTILIHKAKSIDPVIELKVDIRTQTHEDKKFFVNHIMVNRHTKYLGCILLNDGTIEALKQK